MFFHQSSPYPLFLNKIDIGSSNILKPGVGLKLKENRFFLRLPFTIDPSAQSHGKATLSMLVLFVGFSSKCAQAEYFSM